VAWGRPRNPRRYAAPAKKNDVGDIGYERFERFLHD